jgi:hypothetical protein
VDTDGRKLDLKTREALAKLKKTDPEAAKRMAGTYFRANTIVKELGATNLSEAIVKVRDMTATLEALGGEEGIQELQGEVGDYRKEIEQFAKGDPALLEELNTSNPEAFGTAITNGLEILSKNPEIFNKTLFPYMIPALEKAGVTGSIKSLLALIKDGKGQEAFDLTAQIDKWLADGKAFADKQKITRTERDPAREELDRRRQELDQREKTNFEQGVGADVNKFNNTATAKVVEPFFKQLNLKPEGRREFVNALNSRVWAAMKKDAAFQRNANALMDKGDAARAARFIHSKFAELMPGEFRKLRDAMYPNFGKMAVKKAPAAANGGAGAASGGGKGAAAGGAAAGGGTGDFKMVTAKPTPDLIDWSKTSEEMFHIGRGIGKAILKDGRKVQWDWAKI